MGRPVLLLPRLDVLPSCHTPSNVSESRWVSEGQRGICLWCRSSSVRPCGAHLRLPFGGGSVSYLCLRVRCSFWSIPLDEGSYLPRVLVWSLVGNFLLCRGPSITFCRSTSSLLRGGPSRWVPPSLCQASHQSSGCDDSWNLNRLCWGCGTRSPSAPGLPTGGPDHSIRGASRPTSPAKGSA